MHDLRALLADRLAPEALTWLDASCEGLRTDGPKRLPVLFPALARRLGREGLGGGRVQAGDADVDLDAWRTCDAGGWCLMEAGAPEPSAHVDLYQHGDMEERIVALRAMALRPIDQATIDLLGEVQRTNMGVHVEAGALDSNLIARALADGGPDAGFTHGDFCRLVLKLAFMDLSIDRMFGGLALGTEELSQRLEDFAQEREAAGRPVWPDTYRFMGHAPIDSARDRLRQAIASDRPEVVAAAADGIRALGDDDLLALLP